MESQKKVVTIAAIRLTFSSEIILRVTSEGI